MGEAYFPTEPSPVKGYSPLLRASQQMGKAESIVIFVPNQTCGQTVFHKEGIHLALAIGDLCLDKGQVR